MNEQGEGPNHGDDNDIFVRFVKKQGRGEKENRGGQRQKNQER